MAAWRTRLAGTGFGLVAGTVGVVSFFPTWTAREPALPATDQFRSCTAAVTAANDTSPEAAASAPPALRRSKNWEQLVHQSRRDSADASSTNAFDVLVVGGGATGSAVALEAAARGLTVALVERGDFACETSSKSTKLIHGGVRYLEKAVYGANVKQLSLVFEALGERAAMLRQAPHLCHVLPTVIPCYSYLDAAFFWAGMKVYDLIAAASGSTIGASRYADRNETLTISPYLARECKLPTAKGRPLVGAVVYYDGQMDDARMNLGAALTAAALGAAVVNYCEAVRIAPAPDGKGNVVTVRDVVTGKQAEVAARFVVSAAGPFTDELRQRCAGATDDGSIDTAGSSGRDPTPSVTTSAGSHVSLPAYFTTPKDTSAERAAILIPKTEDGRVLFIAPWGGATIAGTTDREEVLSGEQLQNPIAPADDLAFILRSMSSILQVPVHETDVTSAWAGLRPLAVETNQRIPAGSASSSTQNVVREHRVTVAPSGLVSVVGGKWTTFRRMGADTVDAMLASGVEPALTERYAGAPDVPRAYTKCLPLVGSPNWFERDHHAATASEFHRQCQASAAVEEPVSTRLWSAYGVKAPLVLRIAEELEADGKGWDTCFASYRVALTKARKATPVERAALPSTSNRDKAAIATPLPSQLGRTMPDGTADRVLPTRPILNAEVVYACRHEMCMTPADFLCRRTRLAFVDAPAALKAVDKVAAIMARELQWTPAQAVAQADAARAFIGTFVPPPHVASDMDDRRAERRSLWQRLTLALRPR